MVASRHGLLQFLAPYVAKFAGCLPGSGQPPLVFAPTTCGGAEIATLKFGEFIF